MPGCSVNDSVPDAASAVHYMSVDDIFHLLRTSGRGCYIIKRDIKDAFRNIAIAPADRPLVAFSWENKACMECCLPFGLTTAPLVSNLLAEDLNWLRSAYSPSAPIVHYHDDFIAIIHISAGRFHEVLAAFNNVYIHLTDALGIPRKVSKDAAGTLVVVLGVKINTALLQARISHDKLPCAASEAASLLHSVNSIFNRFTVTSILSRLTSVRSAACPMTAATTLLGGGILSRYLTASTSFAKNALSSPSTQMRAIRVWASSFSISPCRTFPGTGCLQLHTCLPPTQLLWTPPPPAATWPISTSRRPSWNSASLPSTQPHWAQHRVLAFTDSAITFHGLSKQAFRGPAHCPLLMLLSIAATFNIEVQLLWLPSSENLG